MKEILVLCLTALLFVTSVLCYSVNIEVPSSFSLISNSGESSLYKIELKNGTYDHDVQLLVLKGTHYQMGYDYGRLIANQIYDNYYKFWDNMVPDIWRHYLSQQVPKEFFDEIQGIKDGGDSVGYPSLDSLIIQMITLTNFPGDVEKNIFYLLLDEINDENVSDNNNYGHTGKKSAIPVEERNKLKSLMHLVTKAAQKFKTMSCSFFAVWGSRTENEDLFSMRNLDWAPDTGIADHFLITVYKPDGKIPYATVGFSGVIGSLTGMSSSGITVHEAGNDVSKVTFRGFPWVLRLRYVMENARNLKEAMDIIRNTNNTMGMNHMVASGGDVVKGQKSHPAYALETMKQYTAFFLDNDPREADLKYVDPKTNQTIQLGYPIEEAVWRTNHGFDHQIVNAQLSVTTPHSDSQQRYMILHNSFTGYAKNGTKIGAKEAVTLTSILGDKGNDWFVCPKDKPDGINILSTTYHPASNIIYFALEKGTGKTWRPACCNTYIQLDMNQWFK